MGTPEDVFRGFIEAGRAKFGFLTRQFGFSPAEETVTPPEAALMYQRPDRVVFVHWEWGCLPWVEVALKAKSGRWKSVGLLKLLKDHGHDIEPRIPSRPFDEISEADVQNVLGIYSKTLKEHAQKILGNPSRRTDSSAVTESKKFTRSDAWILLATLYCGANGGTRDQIVAAADSINHAIPTEKEWSGAVSRLRDSGILEECDGCMFVADKIRRRLPTISKQPRTSVHKNLQRVEEFLGGLDKAGKRSTS